MRRCPKCHRWLSPFVLMYLRREIACPKCWTILRVGAWKAGLVGAGIGFLVQVVVLYKHGVAIVQHGAHAGRNRQWQSVIYLPLLAAYIFAVLFPPIAIAPEDEPLSESDDPP